MVCAAFARPRLALILSGAARTLGQPLLHRSIRANVIEAFGGDVTLLARVRITDARGDHANPRVNALIVPSEAKVRAALAHISSAARRARIEVLPRDAPRGPAACWPGSYHPSLLAQAAERIESLYLLREDEAASGETHDLVMSTRPDVAWLHALRPHCFWDLETRVRLWDWAWLLPRRDAEAFFTAPSQRLATHCAPPPNESAPSAMSKSTKPAFQSAESFFYQTFRAHEAPEQLPAALTRMDIEGVPERSYPARRNRYQTRWIRPAASTAALTPTAPCEPAKEDKELDAARESPLLPCRPPPAPSPSIGTGRRHSSSSVPRAPGPPPPRVVHDELTWRNPCANEPLE